jgi:hypothetical protein
VASSISWPETVDEVIGSDQIVALAHLTPANGVVITPLTNFGGLRDAHAGTVMTINSSVGMWRKLERIRKEPRIALAYHSRAHGFTDRPEYVLVQGRARVTEPHRRWVDSDPQIRASFDRFAGGNPRDGGLWGWWLRAWHIRVGVELEVERVVVWADLRCQGPAETFGAPPPIEAPPPQSPPSRGTEPRIDHRRAARRAKRLPHRLLGWAGTDGSPMVVPVDVIGSDERGLILQGPNRFVPEGGRRAGLTNHWFANYAVGQNQRIHTGWLEHASDRIVYAPHTERGYFLPPLKVAYKVGAGYVTRRGLTEGRRAGVEICQTPAQAACLSSEDGATR